MPELAAVALRRPALAMAMLAIVAWSLSVVDGRLFLGQVIPRRWR